MANTHNLFQQFNSDLQITDTKRKKMITSRDSLRDKIRKDFEENHNDYNPTFYIQGSYKMRTTIRSKDDTCDLDDGVYFDSNPDDVTCTTLQTWVKNAVDGTTDDIQHRKKCITVNYKADYNIDLPVYLFDKDNDAHPSLAVKNGDWREDDPKEMVTAFNEAKDNKGQLLKIVRYLKAWCDHKREKMPSGLAMTILSMNDFQTNDRDDVALKYTLIEIEKSLKKKFECIVPATPNDNIFADYDETRKNNFLNNLSDFIADAKKAVDEKNQLKASKLWQKHLGDRFPDGENKDEENINAKSVAVVASTSKPYYAK
jgi:hypothetical protein